MKVTERFSDRVENYVKYRPNYPKEIIRFLENEIGLASTSIIADIGSGTGISSEMFLKNGNTVYGIEPNREMREAGEKLLNSYSNFYSIKGSAEDTSLANHIVDHITVGQAFHWFDTAKAAIEFKRIIKKDGWVVLIWNERETNTSSFLTAYEEFLNTYGSDYKEVNHVNVYGSIEQLFSKKGYKLKSFPNSQIFDYRGLEGRVLSSSYIPSGEDSKYFLVLAELQKLFDKYKDDGSVIFDYTTKIFYGQLAS